VTLILSLLAAPLAAEARQPAQVPRIGILITGTASTSEPNIEAFRQGLRALGYVEGQHIVLVLGLSLPVHARLRRWWMRTANTLKNGNNDLAATEIVHHGS
jgi:hypothetical protein